MVLLMKTSFSYQEEYHRKVKGKLPLLTKHAKRWHESYVSNGPAPRFIEATEEAYFLIKNTSSFPKTVVYCLLTIWIYKIFAEPNFFFFTNFCLTFFFMNLLGCHRCVWWFARMWFPGEIWMQDGTFQHPDERFQLVENYIMTFFNRLHSDPMPEWSDSLSMRQLNRERKRNLKEMSKK